MDLATGYDFSKPADRRRAWNKVMTEEPYILIGGIPHTLLSQLGKIGMAKYDSDPAYNLIEQVKQHIRFCCVLYRVQLSKGRIFLHEHPRSVASWNLDCIANLLQDPRVEKAAGFVSSSWCILEELSLKHDGKQGQAHAIGRDKWGSRTVQVAAFPEVSCEAIARGVVKQKIHDQFNLKTSRSMVKHELKAMLRKLCSVENVIRPPGEWDETWLDKVHHVEEHTISTMTGDKAWDDVSGLPLDPELVAKARAVEMDFFKRMGVYTVVDGSDQRRTGGKIIDLKWIDTNKGDSSNPNLRARLVGREFNVSKDDSLYASTPPLEAVRLVISRAATIPNNGDTHGGRGKGMKGLMINDVSRAYFYAKCERDVYVRLPPEDPNSGPGKLGKLNLCLYGTRDAAKSWQEALSQHLIQNGFRRGRGFPSVFFHAERDICTLVHGDDYFSAGTEQNLDWLQAVLEKRYELKTQRVGRTSGALREGKILNRVVRVIKGGYEYEADPRQAEAIVDNMGITGKGVVTAGTDQDQEGEEEGEEKLDDIMSREFRAIAAKANYLSQDRPDLQFAVKEICRQMSSPTMGSWRRLKRIAQYLQGRPRVVWKFEEQVDPGCIEIFSDANFACCRKSRKSTSGGAICMGRHCLRTWSKTQSVIARSSAESELYAAARAGCEGLGMITLMNEMGRQVRARLHLDATAAIGILERRGLHKVRHLDVDLLWLQAHAAKEVLPIYKVGTDENAADLMTKNLGQHRVNDLMAKLMLEYRDGRAAVASQLYGVQGTRPVGDSWVSKGVNDQWVREHTTVRRSLFTPFKVSQGPVRGTPLSNVRRTIGRLTSGENFDFSDDWTDPNCAHRLLHKPWRGQTVFQLKGTQCTDLDSIECHGMLRSSMCRLGASSRGSLEPYHVHNYIGDFCNAWLKKHVFTFYMVAEPRF